MLDNKKQHRAGSVLDSSSYDPDGIWTLDVQSSVPFVLKPSSTNIKTLEVHAMGHQSLSQTNASSPSCLYSCTLPVRTFVWNPEVFSISSSSAILQHYTNFNFQQRDVGDCYLNSSKPSTSQEGWAYCLQWWWSQFSSMHFLHNTAVQYCSWAWYLTITQIWKTVP